MYNLVTSSGYKMSGQMKEIKEQALFSLDFLAGRAVGGAYAAGPETFYGYYPMAKAAEARAALFSWDGSGPIRVEVEAIGVWLSIQLD